jgi:hypothetical protein
MRRANRDINTLSLSALDLFATAMGAFAIIMLILFPHYAPTNPTPPKDRPPVTSSPRPDAPFVNSLGMKFMPVATGGSAGQAPEKTSPDDAKK